MEKLIILDNGHGRETKGKRSPVWKDGSQLFEWEFNRDIVNRILPKLKAAGVDVIELVPEDKDISLPERCKRVNRICEKNDCILISVHANAGGGTGWECYTTVGETESDKYAEVLCKQFEKDFPEWKMRFDHSDGDCDKESQFYILRHTVCPAILTENFFMDNPKDCAELFKDEFRERIAKAHFAALQKICSAN